MPKILVLHGPNLNLLGDRETQHYGRDTLAAINQRLIEQGARAGFEVSAFQSNAEAPLIERIHAAKTDETAYIIINPAAFSFTSMALLDALKMFPGPIIELHLSNIHRREPIYHRSLVSSVATAVIAGLGANGYPAAVNAMNRYLSEQPAR